MAVWQLRVAVTWYCGSSHYLALRYGTVNWPHKWRLCLVCLQILSWNNLETWLLDTILKQPRNVITKSYFNPYAGGGYFGQYNMMQSTSKMTWSMEHGYSSNSSQLELLNNWPHKWLLCLVCLQILSWNNLETWLLDTILKQPRNLITKSYFNPYACGGYFGQNKMMQNTSKMTWSMEHGYSSKSSQLKLFNEYKHDRVSMCVSLCFGQK